jgi:uncharacterized membrane protein YbhN (UPF0104 family)
MSWRRRLFVLGLGIGLLLFLRQVWIGYRAIQEHGLSSFQPAFLVAALAATLLMYFLQMLAWFTIMRYLGIPLRLGDTLQGFYLSFLPRYIPGTVWGYLSRSQWLEQSYAVDYAVSVMGSVLEALALVLTGLFVAGAYICANVSGSTQLILALACASLFGLALLVPRFALQIGRRVYSERLPLPGGAQGARSRLWIAAILLYFALWTVFGSALLLTINALLAVSSTDLFVSVFSASLSWVVGFLAVFVPTGIGVRELALSTLLTSHADLAPWQADLVAVVSRFEIILAELIWLLLGIGVYTGRWLGSRSQREQTSQFRRK